MSSQGPPRHHRRPNDRPSGGHAKKPRPNAPHAATGSATSTPALTPGTMTPAPQQQSTIASATTQTRFAEFEGLSAPLLANIPFEFCTEVSRRAREGEGRKEADPHAQVQAATLPTIIKGLDVLAQAKTGTGKTLAFLVPALQRLVTARNPSGVSILVLSPTRELAQQIAVAAEGLLGGAFAGHFGVQCVVGGTNVNTDIKNLKTRRADVLVATPGRMIDLLENSDLKARLGGLSTLVLDEADRLLDAGFRRELLKILEALPDRRSVPRQTLLFSATLPAEVHSISSIALLPDHRFISTLKDEDVNAHKHVVQESLVVEPKDVIAATVEVLRREEMLAGERGGFKGELGCCRRIRWVQQVISAHTPVMVFLPTARAAGLYYEIFAALPTGWPVWEIHSRLSQSKRTKATDEFRAADRGVLFSSDVTARGIDVQGVTGVVQVGLPSSGEQCELGCDRRFDPTDDVQTSTASAVPPVPVPRATASSSSPTLRPSSSLTRRSRRSPCTSTLPLTLLCSRTRTRWLTRR